MPMESMTYSSTKLQLSASAQLGETGWTFSVQKLRSNARTYTIGTDLTMRECVELFKYLGLIESPYIHDAVENLKKHAKDLYKVRDGMGHIFTAPNPPEETQD